MATAKLITTADFIGEYSIPTGAYMVDRLQATIDEVEQEVLYHLFGTTMTASFLADVSGGVPASALYLALYNPIFVSAPCTFEDYSTGMKEMLKCFVYYNWYQRIQVAGSSVGQKGHNQLNSENAKPNSLYNARVYNKGVANYKVIQDYINQNPENYDYSEYDGVDRNYVDAW